MNELKRKKLPEGSHWIKLQEGTRGNKQYWAYIAKLKREGKLKDSDLPHEFTETDAEYIAHMKRLGYDTKKLHL